MQVPLIRYSGHLTTPDDVQRAIKVANMMGKQGELMDAGKYDSLDFSKNTEVVKQLRHRGARRIIFTGRGDAVRRSGEVKSKGERNVIVTDQHVIIADVDAEADTISILRCFLLQDILPRTGG